MLSSINRKKKSVRLDLLLYGSRTLEQTQLLFGCLFQSDSLPLWAPIWAQHTQTQTSFYLLFLFCYCLYLTLSNYTHSHRHTVIDGPVMISAWIVDEGHAAMVTGAVSDSPPPVCAYVGYLCLQTLHCGYLPHPSLFLFLNLCLYYHLYWVSFLCVFSCVCVSMCLSVCLFVYILEQNHKFFSPGLFFNLLNVRHSPSWRPEFGEGKTQKKTSGETEQKQSENKKLKKKE